MAVASLTTCPDPVPFFLALRVGSIGPLSHLLGSVCVLVSGDVDACEGGCTCLAASLSSPVKSIEATDVPVFKKKHDVTTLLS